jgi:hypothetical protein
VKTPFGFDCPYFFGPYFFGDYYRGRSREECRLLLPGSQSSRWSVNLCRACPVPGIVRANSCPNLSLSGLISSGFLGLGKKMVISAYCTLSKSIVSEPHIGCGQCHPLPPEFTQGKK